MIRVAIAVLTGLMLAGCASRGPASIAGGECRIFERPDYAVLGRTRYDQNWIDSQVEGGVAGCRWARPAPRPKQIDARQSKVSTARVAAEAPKRRSVLRKIRDRITPPAVVVWPDPAPPAVVDPPVAASPPRDRVDDLLRPPK